MDERRLIWTFTAKQQRDDIFEYWNHRNKSKKFSKKLKLKILEKSKLLKTQPLSGRIIPETHYRILIFGDFSMIYSIYKNEIQIKSFWDNRQNPEKLKQILGL